MPGDAASGYPPSGDAASGYPADIANPQGSDAPGYGSGFGTGQYPGSDAAGSGYNPLPGDGGFGAASLVQRPKTLKQRAMDAFREGKGDEAINLLAAHYLTHPDSGSELARNMQWSAAMRRPALMTRVGIVVVYATQPPGWDGDPQAIGSAELDKALAAQSGGAEGKKEGAPRKSRRLGGDREGDQAGYSATAGSGTADYSAASGDGQGGKLPTSPQEELAFFTGEIGTKLVEKLKARMETGALGPILRDALREAPQPKRDPNADAYNPADSGTADVVSSAPGYGAQPGDAAAPAAGAAYKKDAGGVIIGQVIPGVEFLGTVANMKELGELAKTASVDVLIVFDVKARPATAISFVNNDTRFRVVAPAKLNDLLFHSVSLNNKQVMEGRKKKNAEDQVEAETTKAVEALVSTYKMAPLPQLTAEQAAKRISFLTSAKPADATSLLLEARLFVAKKLLKTEEMQSLALANVTDEQLEALSGALSGEDVKEKIVSAIASGTPTTVLGKFTRALSGAGGLSSAIPEPQMPPVMLPGSGGPGYGQPGFVPQSGSPSTPGDYVPPSDKMP
jgi:hypothetical protein